MNIVVVGDVHGNARALRAALVRARAGAMDHLVFVGDLLTYGHDIDEVLDLVGEAQLREGATLLTGNHDQMYFDLFEGKTSYFDKLPDWLKETIEYTAARLDRRRFRAGLRWSEEHCHDGVLFAHANPFGIGDWTYLNHPDDRTRAAETLAARGFDLGVFGHTHRARWGETDGIAGTSTTSERKAPIVANAGSVGQPRNMRAEAIVLRLELHPGSAAAHFEPVTYDVQAHVAGLPASLSDRTRDRLASFFLPRTDSLRGTT